MSKVTFVVRFSEGNIAYTEFGGFQSIQLAYHYAVKAAEGSRWFIYAVA